MTAKQRQYVITTGQYDSYRIVAFVQGNARPALSTLRKQFDERYGIQHPKFTDGMGAISAAIRSEDAAVRQLVDEGYSGEYNSLAELFIDWLVKNHGFTVMKDIDEMNL